MDLDDRWATWRRDVACLGACTLLAWFGLLGDRVPLLSLVDLGFHELGHLIGYVIRPPELVVAALGSFTQVAVPLGLAVYFHLNQHDRAGTSVCLAWAATSAANAAAYVADAPTEALPLIGGNHDWAFILGSDGLDRLDQAATWASTIRVGAWLCFLVALAVALAPLLAGRPNSGPATQVAPAPERSGRRLPRI